MSKKTIASRPLILCCLILSFLIPVSLHAQEGGGTSGADFLIHPPASRADAMGGIIDGMGIDLEGILLNPSVMTAAPGFLVQINITPLPNDVTHNQLAFGIPMFGGMMGVSVQMLNAGEFIHINESGQAQATLSIYDAAAVVGYSRYIWKTISVGLNAKGIYRSLGTDSAFAFGVDAGTTAWFETPHIGRPPKPPTLQQLESELEKEKKGIETTKESRVKEVSKEMASLSREVDNLSASLADLEEKIAAAAEDKKEALLTRKVEVEESLSARTQLLEEELQKNKEALSEIDSWYNQKMSEAQARFDRKLADLDNIKNERQKLFSVINDPEQELTDGMIDDNIDKSISRTGDFIEERRKALTEAAGAYEEKRDTRIEGIREEIKSYRSQIESETGPEAARINREIETLKTQIASLETAEGDEAKTSLKEAQSVLGAKEKELESLLDDPWLKRLARRIEDKQIEIEGIEKDILANGEAAVKAAEEIAAQSEKDIESFEALRVSLKKELKKAKLKKELDVLTAAKERAIEKALRDYKGKEKKTYLKLLSAMYSHEEKIFQSRLTSVREDSEVLRFDFETELQKSLETLEDDFALQERFLSRKIASATKSEGGSDEEETLTTELKEKEAAYKEALAELGQKEKKFDIEENEKLDSEITVIKEERQKVRLIFLQTDKPFLNTSVVLGMRNLGSEVKFAEEGYPLPTIFSAGVGYTLLNIDNHSLRLALQADFPLHDDISVSVGTEYSLFNLAYLRAGYTFNSVERSFSAGFGARLALGFTEYALDYTFRPLPDYGLLHSFGIHISF